MSFLKKFGSHYAIERFGVLFLTLFFALSAVVGSIGIKKFKLDHQALSGNAIYTRSFSMSQSKTNGHVHGVYSNSDHSKVFVLLSFDDLSKLSVNASDYTIYLAGATQDGYYDEIESHPTGEFYMFGNTGYAGIYLQDVSGFPSQLLSLYLCSNVNLSGQRVESTNFLDKFDHGVVYFNPGGAYATHVNFLEMDEWDFFDMVEEIVTRHQERQIRGALFDDLSLMSKKQILIKEYMARLQELNVAIPDVGEILDDSVYGLAADGSTDDRLHYITEYGGGWINDADPPQGFSDDNVVLYFDSDVVVPGGIDFDWQTGSVLNGYLKSLTGSDNPEVWSEFLANLRSSVDTHASDFLNQLEWVRNDGSAIELSEQNVINQVDKDIIATIRLFETALHDYYAAKMQYEMTDLVSLLQLELDARTMFTAYTVNTNENVINVL